MTTPENLQDQGIQRKKNADYFLLSPFVCGYNNSTLIKSR